MENQVVIKIVPIPTLTVEKPGDRLVELYRKLGWNEESKKMVEPSKIKVTESDFSRLLGEEREHAKAIFPNTSEADINVGLNMLWLNRGPSGSGNTPGMVELCEGWLSD